MKEFLSDHCWLSLSQILSLSIEDTKSVIRTTYFKSKMGLIEGKCSPQVFKAMQFYIDNYDMIEIDLEVENP